MARVTKECGCEVERVQLSSKGKIKAYSENIVSKCQTCTDRDAAEVVKRQTEEAEQEVRALVDNKIKDMAKAQLVTDGVLEIVEGKHKKKN